MVIKTFNEFEALKAAIHIEERGRDFYHYAQSIVKNPEALTMLSHLEDQEKQHACTFQGIYNKMLENKEAYDDMYLFEPEAAAYLNAIVESVVFPDSSKEEAVLRQVHSMENVLELGMKAEKDSILYYSELANYSKFQEAREAYLRLLQEERKHLIELQETKKNGAL